MRNNGKVGYGKGDRDVKKRDIIAEGTLLNVMWQPGWEGSLRKNGYMYLSD